jgi:hypothetical protein
MKKFYLFLMKIILMMMNHNKDKFFLIFNFLSIKLCNLKVRLYLLQYQIIEFFFYINV